MDFFEFDVQCELADNCPIHKWYIGYNPNRRTQEGDDPLYVHPSSMSTLYKMIYIFLSFFFYQFSHLIIFYIFYNKIKKKMCS